MSLAVNSQSTPTSTSTSVVLEADLHCHLLPDWDDGPRTLDESLRMAERAAQSGVRRIVVTPHVGRSFVNMRERLPSEIPSATASLQKEIHDRGIALDLLPGAEVMLSSPDLPQRVESEPWLTVGGQGKYILVESPINTWPEIADQMLFEFSVRGVTPIIAHPERLQDVQKDLAIMERVVQRGALLQITARSLVGSERRTRDCCHRLMRAGLVALVASDAHLSRHLWPPEVAGAIRESVGEEAAQLLLKNNPLAVVSGEPVVMPKVNPPTPKRSWFWNS